VKGLRKAVEFRRLIKETEGDEEKKTALKAMMRRLKRRYNNWASSLDKEDK
jgi:uncharacterized protein YlxP (DUF503 family)